MQLEREQGPGNRIQYYVPGELCVNGQVITSHVIVTAETVSADWSPHAVASMTLEDFAPVLAHEPEVVLLGTGQEQRFPHNSIVAGIMQRGVGLEVMDTAAACRTFNVLAGEYRRVVAALMIHTAE